MSLNDDVDRLAGYRPAPLAWALTAAVLAWLALSVCSGPASAREAPPVITPLPRVSAPTVTLPDEVLQRLARACVGLSGFSTVSADPPSTTPLARIAATPRTVTEAERDLLRRAVNGCLDRAGDRLPDPWSALALLRLEDDFGVPAQYRGITLAAWCSESGWADWSIVGDAGQAVGPLQLHPVLARSCGAMSVRDDVVDSAWCWLSAVQATLPKAVRRCGSKRAWVAAQAWVSGGHRGYRCDVVSAHVRRLAKWRAR